MSTNTKFLKEQEKINNAQNLVDHYQGYRITLDGIPHIKSLEKSIIPFHKVIKRKPNEFFTTVIRAPMNFGKTQRCVEYLATKKIKDSPVIAITSRQSLAQNLYARFGDSFRYYKDDNEEDNDRVKNKIITDKKVCIQMESLWRLEHSSLEQLMNTTLILDEKDALLQQLNSATMHNCEDSMMRFYHLLKYCGSVICMSADLEVDTVHLIKKLRPPSTNKNFVVYHYTSQLEDDVQSEHIIYFGKEWFNQLKNHIVRGKNIAIPCLSKKVAQECLDMVSYLVEHDHCIDKSTVYVHSTMNMKERQRIMENVDQNLKCNIFIYTPSISRGVSFNEEHFDVVFAYVSPLVEIIPQEVRQMMRRCRNIKSRKYHIFMTPRYHNYPTNEEEILDYLSTPDPIRNYHLQYDRSEYDIIEKDGVVKYMRRINKEDPHYQVTMHNKKIHNYCMNNYLECYIKQVIDTGASISLHREHIVDWENNMMTQIRSYCQRKTENRQIDYSHEIVAAERITKEVYEKLIKYKDQLDITEIRKIEKYELARLYDVNEDEMTIEFVQKFNDIIIKCKFLNLSYISSIYYKLGCNIENTLLQMAINDEKLFKDKKFLSQLIGWKNCNEIYHRCCHFFVTACGFKNIFDTDTIIRNLLTMYSNFMKKIEEFKEMFTLMKKCFDIRQNVDSLIQSWEKDHKNFLRFINGKLLQMYGVQIESTTRRDDSRNNYKIVHPDFPRLRDLPLNRPSMDVYTTKRSMIEEFE